MFSLFELFSVPRRVVLNQSRGPAGGPAVIDESTPTCLLRYLPLVVLTTVSVVVLPAVLVAAALCRGATLC